MLSMDAQRFDLTKSPRNNLRHLTQPAINNEEILEWQDALSLPEFFSSSSRSSINSPAFELEVENSSSTDIESDQAKEIDNLLNKMENDDTARTDEYTCTIIRPGPRSPLLNIFSRPSSPISPISRPGSPINFGAFNCFGNRDNFEEDIKRLQAQCAKKVEVQVFVTKTKKVYREEAWRALLTELLYRPNPQARTHIVASRDY
ncbi:hypothetical protein C0995_002516 [Termitomyces sp. Mi166|nr:hypothetical protein C0995_002516 [Termitomyces sp. Mi166\